MKNLIKIVLVVLIYSFLGCSKYEDGPAISLRTKKGRITNNWEVDKFINEDGTDVTPTEVQKMTLKKNYSVNFSVGTPAGITVSGTWSFVDEKEGLKIQFPAYNNTSNKDYKILRLKTKELWVYDNNENVEIHFVPE